MVLGLLDLDVRGVAHVATHSDTVQRALFDGVEATLKRIPNNADGEADNAEHPFTADFDPANENSHLIEAHSADKADQANDAHDEYDGPV